MIEVLITVSTFTVSLVGIYYLIALIEKVYSFYQVKSAGNRLRDMLAKANIYTVQDEESEEYVTKRSKLN